MPRNEAPPLPVTGLPQLDENHDLFRLMLSLLAAFCNGIEKSGNEAPKAVIETSSGRFLQAFENQRLELGYEDARKSLLGAPKEALRYAIAWAGFLTIEGVRYEAVLVGGGERGVPSGPIIAQRYKRRLPDVRFEPIGNLKILGSRENLLTMSDDSKAMSMFRPIVVRIIADVDHNVSATGDRASVYAINQCQEMILGFGDLDRPFSKELHKKPDMIHVVQGTKSWAMVFDPEAKEAILGRDTLIPLRGGIPFPGFVEDTMVLMGYMPPIPKGEQAKLIGLFVLWMCKVKVSA